MQKWNLNLIIILLLAFGLACANEPQVADQTLQDFRETYTFPPEMEPLAKGLEEVGFDIVYGPNSIQPPQGISEEAKLAWVKLPQLPLPANDPEKLAVMREMTFLGEDAAFEQLKTAYSLEDREINGITTLWITPPNLKHEDKVMIFVHGGGWILNSRKHSTVRPFAGAQSSRASPRRGSRCSSAATTRSTS